MPKSSSNLDAPAVKWEHPRSPWHHTSVAGATTLRPLFVVPPYRRASTDRHRAAHGHALRDREVMTQARHELPTSPAGTVPTIFARGSAVLTCLTSTRGTAFTLKEQEALGLRFSHECRRNRGVYLSVDHIKGECAFTNWPLSVSCRHLISFSSRPLAAVLPAQRRIRAGSPGRQGSSR